MPTTTTGKATDFITFSRASLATVTDSDGKIKWAAHNLLLASEQFDASAWSVKTGITVGANSSAAPNGTTTADKIAEDNTGGVHTAAQTISISGGINVTYSVFAKSAERTNVAIQMATTGGTLVRFGANFDLTAQTVSKTDLTGGPLDTVSSITAVGDGWYLCTLKMTTISTATSLIVYAGPSDSNNPSFTSGAPSYVGVTGNGALFWGAHLYRSDLGGMVANTSAYPMYNPTTPKNLLGFTEDFSNGYWGKTNILAFGSGSVANAISAPNGLQTADKIVENTANAGHFVQASATVVSGTTYVFSVYAKAAERNFVLVQSNYGNNAFGTVNLTTGATNLLGGTGTLNAVSVGDGWWRISLIAASSSTSGLFNIYTATNSTTFSYTGDGTSGVFLWGAQLSDSASLDPYVANAFAAPTAAAYHGPRLDFDPVTLAARGLLVEEQRTNLLLQSAAFDNAAWTPANVTVTANAASSPDGGNSAELITSSASAGYIYPTNTSLLASAGGGSFTFSVYAKTGSVSSFTMLIGTIEGNFSGAFDLSAVTASASGTNTTANIVAAGNGWYRCSVTKTSLANQAYAELQIGRIASGATIYLYGAQLEAGAFATSYIPTGASTVTRSADVASVATSAFPYSASEGTLVVSSQRLAVGTSRIAQLDSGDNDRIQIAYATSSMNYAVVVSGSAVANLTDTFALTVKGAGAYKANDFAACFNGGTVLTDTSGTVPTATTLRLGSGEGGFSPLNGHLRQITYIPRRLTSAELQARTA